MGSEVDRSYLVQWSESEQPIEVFQVGDVRICVEQHGTDGGVVVIGVNDVEQGVLIGAAICVFVQWQQETYRIVEFDEIGAAVGLLRSVFGSRVGG